MLKLRPAIVLESDAPDARDAAAGVARAALRTSEQRLLVELVTAADGDAVHTSPRPAIADVALVGRAQVGDEVIVNVEALDLGLGSGGFDIVHVNLTRGLDGEEDQDALHARVMKLNYTSLQHVVRPVDDQGVEVPPPRPVAVLALHDQLAAVAWAFAQGAPGARLGYVQTAGGALPGGHSRAVAALVERGLLAGHITAGGAFGGALEAITTAGALHHALGALGWDAAVCGPGPGIVGSGAALGHGGMAALDSAHVALALGCPTLLVAHMSATDEGARHRAISPHTLTVLDLLLEPVTVALPAGMRSPVGTDLRASLGAVFAGGRQARPAVGVDVARPVRITRHDWRRAAVDLPAYAASGLPSETMSRGPAEDPLFFGAALAGGTALAELVAETDPQEGDGEST
jgi:hypothetical protein